MNLPRGTFLAVEGRSGSGKTSLLTCLAGMLEPAGPIDPEVGVIGAWNEEGRLVGCDVI